MTHNDSQVEVAPCPFCGGHPAFDSTDERTRLHCSGCGSEGGLFFFSQEECESGIGDATEARAIAAWNRRTALSALAAGKVEAEPGMAFCPACFVEVKASEADRQTLDARRWRWLVAQHNTINPLAQVVWKRNNRPNGQWVNLIDGGDLIAHVDREISPTLPHPALDRANAGERESEGSQKQEEFCDANCCWSGHHPDCFRALPAADPERREGAEGVAFPDAIEKLRRCTLGCGAFGQCKATMHGKPSECAGGVTPSLAGWRFKSKEGGEWHFDNTKPTGHVFCVEPVYVLGVNACDSGFGVFLPLQDGGGCAVRPCRKPAPTICPAEERRVQWDATPTQPTKEGESR